MPPFREGPIEVDRRLDGETLKELRDIGHGHRINIVDASYDIPRDSKIVNFPGSTAEAFKAVVRLIPVENELGDPDVTIMLRDSDAHPRNISEASYRDLKNTQQELIEEGLGKQTDGDWIDWTNDDALQRQGHEGFYSLANDPNWPHMFIRTQDELPFACVSLVAGHSQRTE